MVRLYGQAQTRRELCRRAGSTRQFAGVQLMTLGNGVEHGIRCLEFRSGTGFCFQVLVDRGMDIGRMDYRGAAIGWHSPTGFRHPGLHEPTGDNGLGFLRSFSGLMLTCGLDHILFPLTDDASHFGYDHRATSFHPLHGRVAFTPALLTGYGEQWNGDECTLWCEGVVTQAVVFGEHLKLFRRIEVKVGESQLTLVDRVVNRGFKRTPHMYLYHINVGYPVLDEGSIFLAPIRETIWASHEAKLQDQGVGYRSQPGPLVHFHEQVFEHAIEADADHKVPVGLINERLGLGFFVEFDRREFPHLFQWQNFQEGLYALGIEPSTNHVLGKLYAREQGQLRWLDHGEGCSYTTRIGVVDGSEALRALRERIESICRQPAADYPSITGNWSLAPPGLEE